MLLSFFLSKFTKSLYVTNVLIASSQRCQSKDLIFKSFLGFSSNTPYILSNNSLILNVKLGKLPPTLMYKESCVFVCEDFPKENQKLANEQLTLVKLKLAIFYILCCVFVVFFYFFLTVFASFVSGQFVKFYWFRFRKRF